VSFDTINSLRSDWAEERYANLPGQWFGDVKVVGFAETNKNKVRRVLVRCRCGNEYPMTEIYLRKRGQTRCQRCSQILKNRGRDGYLEFIKQGNFKVYKKTSDDAFRGTRHLKGS